MELGIKGKVALITGASRGIGMAVAKALALEGAQIIAVSRTMENLRVLLNSLPKGRHTSLELDLEKHDALDDLQATMVSKGVDPDIIVNNVGGNLNITDPLCNIEDWRRVFRLNVEVAVDLNRRFIPKMREKKWGRIN